MSASKSEDKKVEESLDIVYRASFILLGIGALVGVTAVLILVLFVHKDYCQEVSNFYHVQTSTYHTADGTDVCLVHLDGNQWYPLTDTVLIAKGGGASSPSLATPYP